MYKSLAILLLFILCSDAFSTGQQADCVFIDGEAHSLLSFPLDSRDEPPKPEWLDSTSTANYRGYVGQWKIEGDTLYLVSVVRCEDTCRDITSWFLSDGEIAPLKATWFSGVLRIGMGKELTYFHGGFERYYEREAYAAVRGGRVTHRETIDNTKEGHTRSWWDIERIVSEGESDSVESDFIDLRVFEEFEGDGEWHTKIAAELTKSKRVFKTRGFYSERMGDAYSLFVPLTPSTNTVSIPIVWVGEAPQLDDNAAVEITGHLEIGDQPWAHHVLHAHSVQLLPKGRSIHSPTFEPIEGVEFELRTGWEGKHCAAFLNDD